jgi:hypothetical protein
MRRRVTLIQNKVATITCAAIVNKLTMDEMQTTKSNTSSPTSALLSFNPAWLPR